MQTGGRKTVTSCGHPLWTTHFESIGAASGFKNRYFCGLRYHKGWTELA